ncbi:LuxR C-terminal-related transcriptional regulator [Amycolatopsis sp. SID8362]|uniref:helix-turn-helix transcriptional regulator n=1 Tax=Amycolatopsis sp. SID8362 TaxID=2690346 RepID=UPI00136F2321|nr:LuxR C-terminal-related transcriptional regulator [Amycolatopsis sp. SID8362]NBH08295.1 hypothetical protein [Amycolatopsis sp. SID8362]NED44990.1 LuxR family transcriptional regulator [Amycolatopsis sp. SID8362]
MVIGEAARLDPALWGHYADLTRLLEDNARRAATPAARLLPACAHAVQHDDPDVWRQAIDLWRRTGRKDLGLPLLDHAARVARSRGDRRLTGELAAQARELAASMGVPWQVPEPAMGRRADAAERLTDREHRIAMMARSGLKNAAIAHERCISRGTVATHLARAYRKLRVGSRVELVLALADDN